jgi:hypothetical protein
MRDLAVGFANLIADSGLGVYNPTGAYAATDTAIVFKDLPPAPNRCIVLTAVPLTDAEVIPLGKVLVQVRLRGNPNDPLDVDDLGDAITDLVHGARNLTFGSTHAVQILRNSSVPMGVDNAKRWTRIDHFYVDLDYPATANRPDGGWS